MEDYERYSSSYRAAETRQVMDWIKAGQCGSIIGFYGVGKSNFLRFLLRQDIINNYLGSQSNDFIFILIDLHSLVEVTDWAVYELILNHLVEQLHPSNIEDSVASEILSLHQGVLSNRDPLTAQRSIYKSVELLYRRQGRRIALLFDEFDSVFTALNPSIFRSLRAIRDAHKGQLSYVAAGITEFTDLHGNSPDMEYFCELVNRNICRLGPYNETDTKQTIVYRASQRSMEINNTNIERLFTVTGGHADLLNTLLNILWSSEYENDLEKLLPIILDQPTFRRACTKLWKSISESEQNILAALAHNQPFEWKDIRFLKMRGLVSQNDEMPPIPFSPLFLSFIRQEVLPSPAQTVQTPLPTIQDTIISRSPQIVQIGGVLIEDLTELEFELLFYLYEKRGYICKKNDLMKNVYSDRYVSLESMSDEPIQTLISRLRAKIEPDAKYPQYILTIRGQGYKFVLNVTS